MRFLIVILLLLPLQSLIAGEKEQMERNDYSIRNGMPSNEVSDICQDNFGFLWIATGNGIARFDGYEFLSLSSSQGLSSDKVLSLTSSGGVLCALTSAGIDLIDVSDLSVRHIKDTLLTDAKIRTIVFRGKDKILLGGRGIYEYDVSTGKLLKLAQMQVRTLYCDSVGNVWIGTWGNGIFWIPVRSGVIEKYYLEGALNKIKVNCFSENGRGGVLVGTWGSGLLCLNSPELTPASVTRLFGRADGMRQLDWNIIYSIVSDKKGQVYAGTPGGLLETDFGLAEEIRHDEPFREVKVLFCDREGNIWVSNQGRGMSMLSYAQEAVQEITLAEFGIKHTGITAVYAGPGGIFWLGVQGYGVVRLDMERRILLPENSILKSLNASSSNSVVAFAANPKSSSLMMATRYDGVYELVLKGNEPSSVHHYNTASCPGVNKYTDAIFRDSENHFWIGTHSGLALIQDGVISQPEAINKDMGYARVTSICQNGPDMYFGTFGKGIVKSCGGEVRFYSVESGNLSSDNVLCLFRDNAGRLWAGTSSGLFCYNEKTDDFTLSPVSVRLLSDEVVSITEDRDGMLWIATGNGFSRLDPNGNTLSNFGFLSSLKNLSYFPGASVANEGQVALGGYSALTVFNTDEVMSLSDVSVPVITRLMSSGRVLSISPDIGKIVLRHNERNLSISFASPSFSSAAYIKYSYRMSGWDSQWQYTSSAGRTVNYLNLRRRHYRFEVRASDFSGSWTEPSVLLIEIRKSPFVR